MLARSRNTMAAPPEVPKAAKPGALGDLLGCEAVNCSLGVWDAPICSVPEGVPGC